MFIAASDLDCSNRSTARSWHTSYKSEAYVLKWKYRSPWCGRRSGDLIVERTVVVELKSIETIAPVHKKQLLTYLRLTDRRVGLLINFGTELLIDGIHRVVNNLEA